jgi:hypothetical protein
LSFHVVESGQEGSLSVATVKGTSSPTSTSNIWTEVILTSPVTLLSGTTYFIVAQVSGGSFSFYRGMSDMIAGGLAYMNMGSGLSAMNAGRGDDLDIQLFGCQ